MTARPSLCGSLRVFGDIKANNRTRYPAMRGLARSGRLIERQKRNQSRCINPHVIVLLDPLANAQLTASVPVAAFWANCEEAVEESARALDLVQKSSFARRPGGRSWTKRDETSAMDRKKAARYDAARPWYRFFRRCTLTQSSVTKIKSALLLL
jgi:hypothetical protein